MAFVKITEQPSLYDNLEKKSVLEISVSYTHLTLPTILLV